MPVRRLNHAVLYVNGLEREVDFYTKTLGFEVRMEIPGRAAFLRSPGLGQRPRPGAFQPRRGPRGPVGPRSGCTTSPGRSARSPSSWRRGEKLLEAGALVGESDHRLSKSLYAKDPSGIEFEVMWRVPVEDWDSELAQGDDYTVPLDWDRTLDPLGHPPGNGCRRGLSHLTDVRLRTRTHRAGGYSPVAPSMRSRSRSAWPRWRAYSSIMCR